MRHEVAMSLNFAPSLFEQAERGQVDEGEFVAAVARSLPYAWSVMSGVAEELAGGFTNREGFADHATPPPSETERGQLLRALASDASGGHWSGISGSDSPSRTAIASRPSAGGRGWRRLPGIRLGAQPGAEPEPGAEGLLTEGFSGASRERFRAIPRGRGMVTR